MGAKAREQRDARERRRDDKPTAPSFPRASGVQPRSGRVDVIEIDAARTLDPRRELEDDDDDDDDAGW